METVAVNAGTIRRETIHGRSYLVAPFVSIVADSVLTGSAGALFYPADEISRDVTAWDGMPIVVRHPVRNGGPVSARDPDVIGETGVGNVYRSAFTDGKLKGEAWLDVDALRRVDANLYAAISAGKACELSTGLFTRNEPVENGTAPDGRPYTHVARDYRPDHLALLPDETGACAVAHGCGLNVNHQPTLFDGDTMKRDKLIAYLVANCACGAKPADVKARLETMSDDDLLAAKKDHVAGKVLNALLAGKKLVANKKLVTNAEGEVAPGVAIADLAEFLGITIDPANDPGGFTKAILEALDGIRAKLAGEEPAAEEPTPEPAVEVAPAMNVSKPKTAAQWLAEAPPEIRSAVANAQAVEARERAAMIAHCLNALPEPMRPGMQPVYQAMATPALAALAASVPVGNEAHTPAALQPSYVGNGGAAWNRAAKDDSANVLPTFEMDWSHMASPKLRKP
jgi:hypothetical protein